MMNVVVTRRDKATEERMRRVGFAEEFGMILAGHKKRMIFQFDYFNQFSIRGRAAKNKAGLLEWGAIGIIEFVAMPMAFVDDEGAIELRGL